MFSNRGALPPGANYAVQSSSDLLPEQAPQASGERGTVPRGGDRWMVADASIDRPLRTYGRAHKCNGEKTRLEDGVKVCRPG